jgi:hypothetical protein
VAINELANKMEEILNTALVWAAKAYEINSEDPLHNRMYGQILVRLVLPVPDDLQEKLDSYIKH